MEINLRGRGGSGSVATRPLAGEPMHISSWPPARPPPSTELGLNSFLVMGSGGVKLRGDTLGGDPHFQLPNPPSFLLDTSDSSFTSPSSSVRWALVTLAGPLAQGQLHLAKMTWVQSHGAHTGLGPQSHSDSCWCGVIVCACGVCV